MQHSQSRPVVGILSLIVSLIAGAATAGDPVCDPDPPCPVENGETIEIEIRTPLGVIPVELWPEVAPLTVANFLGYIDRGDLSDSLVHRNVPGFVIQGGGFRFTNLDLVPTVDPVCAEPCRTSKRATISMARTSDPNSATSQWFINTADNFTLDPPSTEPGFTVFGRVTGNGMEIVDEINELPVTYGELTLPTVFFRAFGAEIPYLTPAPPLGCAAEDDVAILFDSEAQMPRSDEFGRFVFYSPGCDVSPPPLAECKDDPGITVIPVALETDIFRCVFELGAPSSPCFEATAGLTPMSCEGAAASDATLLPFADHVAANLVRTEIVRVPEPAWAFGANAAAFALLWLRRRKRA